jgi:uncharacterized protein
MKRIIVTIVLPLLLLITSSMNAVAGEIHDAVEQGKIERVKALLQADPALLNAEGHDYTTPLHWAAARGHHAIAELLLSKKPNIEAADRYGMTPLLTAAQNGHASTTELLLTHGASIEAKDKSAKTALHWAAIFNRKDVVQLLLRHNANLNARDKHNETPLQKSKQNGFAEVSALLEAHAKKR